jgi:hypothetical protein
MRQMMRTKEFTRSHEPVWQLVLETIFYFENNKIDFITDKVFVIWIKDLIGT